VVHVPKVHSAQMDRYICILGVALALRYIYYYYSGLRAPRRPARPP